MAAIQYWLWLSAAGISPKAKAALLARYGDAEAAYFAPDGELARTNGISPSEAVLLERRSLERSSRIADECARQGIGIISLQDAAYPKRLKNIYSPPVVLYLKGNLPVVDENALIAVIGTRKASPYGIKMGRTLAYQISACGGIVVSLLTQGIDAEAARGALLAGGRCVAVLGTPHDCENSRLAADVAASGAVISEYPPGMRPVKQFFRERNRVAAGISVGLAVIEAPEKSGTRLFAEEAAEQGKEIFAVPGNADAQGSEGTNCLLKEGAKLVTCGWDVMCEFQQLYPDKIKQSKDISPPEEKTGQNAEIQGASAKKGIDNAQGKGYIDLKEQLSSLSEEQLKIITAIDGEGTHIDDIIEASGLPASKVLGQITMLELRGFVRRLPGMRISLNIAKK